MRSNAQPTQELNPLEESTYEVLHYETSDDEGHTASVASTTPDDVSTFDDDDDDFEQEFVDDPAQDPEPAAADASDLHTFSGVHDSTLTETPHLDASESTRVIRLQEEPNAEDAGIDAWGVHKEFTEAQSSDGILSRYGRSETRLTVRAALSERYLPVGGSFNVLYIGNIENWYKEAIETHVHAALHTSPGPSRSIMMRGQMEPYGPVVTADHCSNIKVLEEAGKDTGITVTLDDGSELTVGTRKAQRNADSNLLPDLVVFWYPQSELPAPEVSKFPVACEAFERHQIPCLHVATNWRFHLHSKGFAGNKSLRFCVEGRDDDQSDFEQQESIPVDVYTFLNLDPSQLNRHLAALAAPTGAANSSNLAAPARKFSVLNLVNKANTFMKDNTPQLNTPVSPNTKKLLLAFAALVTLTTLYLLGALAIPPPWSKYNPSHTPEVLSNVPTVFTILSPPPVSSPTATSESEVSSPTPSNLVKTAPWDVPVVPTIEQPRPQKQERKEHKKHEKMGGYEIQATGEHQFVLSPSKDFGRKRKPQLQIQVSKDSKAVPIQYFRTIQGAYVVDLEQEYPIGSFNVSIATHTKPLMQQSFAITMGHKSRLAWVVDAVKSDIVTAQQGLRNLTSSLSTRVKAELAGLENGTGDWKKKVHQTTREAADHLQEAKKEAKRQIAAGKAFLRDVSAGTWMGLREVTAPVRTSPTTLKARNNAFRIRCSFEQAVGLSSRDRPGKKTRSCKKIGW